MIRIPLVAEMSAPLSVYFKLDQGTFTNYQSRSCVIDVWVIVPGQLLEIAECLFGIRLEVRIIQEIATSSPQRKKNVELKLRLNYDNYK